MTGRRRRPLPDQQRHLKGTQVRLRLTPISERKGGIHGDGPGGENTPPGVLTFTLVRRRLPGLSCRAGRGAVLHDPKRGIRFCWAKDQLRDLKVEVSEANLKTTFLRLECSRVVIVKQDSTGKMSIDDILPPPPVSPPETRSPAAPPQMGGAPP